LHLRPTEQGPRPKPRPAYGQHSVPDNNPSIDTCMATSTPRTKRPSNVNAEAVAVKKQRTREQVEDHTPADEEESGQFSRLPERVRRGARQRKAVKF
jgi:hypothetical protein